jgi:hypothetical protein
MVIADECPTGVHIQVAADWDMAFPGTGESSAYRENSMHRGGTSMTTNYDPIAQQYKRSKQQPWRTYVEAFTLMRLIGDPTGRAVIDVACGGATLAAAPKPETSSRRSAPGPSKDSTRPTQRCKNAGRRSVISAWFRSRMAGIAAFQPIAVDRDPAGIARCGLCSVQGASGDHKKAKRLRHLNPATSA